MTTRYQHGLVSVMNPNNSLSLLKFATVISLALACQPVMAAASDLERERRLAEQTVDAILDGEPVDLDSGTHTFLGIHMEAEQQPEKGAVIILHGRGMHPDWAQVANPLRTALPAAGWTTLSLQMPVLEKDAKYYDYEPLFEQAGPRIDAGIRFLQRAGSKRIILLAHSCSVHMSMAWIRQQGTGVLDAYIGIGMGATDYGQPIREPLPLDKIDIPLLNIRGSEDYPAVHRLAEDIGTMIDSMHPASAQVIVEGADHYYNDYEDELITAVSAWLESLR